MGSSLSNLAQIAAPVASIATGLGPIAPLLGAGISLLAKPSAPTINAPAPIAAPVAPVAPQPLTAISPQASAQTAAGSTISAERAALTAMQGVSALNAATLGNSSKNLQIKTLLGQ